MSARGNARRDRNSGKLHEKTESNRTEGMRARTEGR